MQQNNYLLSEGMKVYNGKYNLRENISLLHLRIKRNHAYPWRPTVNFISMTFLLNISVSPQGPAHGCEPTGCSVNKWLKIKGIIMAGNNDTSFHLNVYQEPALVGAL